MRSRISVVLLTAAALGSLATIAERSGPLFVAAAEADVLPETPVGPPSADRLRKTPVKLARMENPRDDRMKKLVLSVSYAQRIEVPRGSSLEIKVLDASGKQISQRRAMTHEGFPPYPIQVLVGESSAFPLKIVARLTSKIGHRFSGTSDIESEQAGEKPIGIMMRSE